MSKQPIQDKAFTTISQQQEQFVGLIFNDESSHGYCDEGMEIYRRNLKATATQALSISFPTVHTLIGADLFAYATEKLLVSEPPQYGDWGLWGNGFADTLQQLPQLEEYPYVADCAHLDFAIHQVEKRNNNVFDASSANLLAEVELDELFIKLSDAIAVLSSDYPIIALWHIHYDDNPQPYIEQFKQGLNKSDFKQVVLVVRPKYKAQIQSISDAEYQWIKHMLAGKSIGHALDLIETEGFELEQWLPRAIEQNCIERFYTKSIK